MSGLCQSCCFVSHQRVLWLCHSKPMAGEPGRVPLCTPQLVPLGGVEGWIAVVFGAFSLVKLEAEVLYEHLCCN